MDYVQFPDKATMDGVYATYVQQLGATHDSGQCSGSTWPQEEGYTVSGQDAGRVVCGKLSGVGEIAWEDARTLIFSFAIRADGNQQLLYEFWTNGGPN